MRYLIEVSDTRDGIAVSLTQQPSGVQDNPDSLATLHTARILQDLKKLRDKGLVRCKNLNI